MKVKNKKSSMFVALLTTAALLSACSGNNGNAPGAEATNSPSSNPPATEAPAVYENGLPKDEKVTLKVGFLEAGYGREWFDHAVSRFTEQYPNVTFDITASPKIPELITTKAAAGDDEDMFDILYGLAYTEFVDANKLEPLTDLFQMQPSDGGGKTLNELIVPGYNVPEQYYKGENWLFPIANYVGGMFYDQKLFKENGWNQSPKTYDEFLALCEAIKSKGIDPIVYSGLYNYSIFSFDTKVFELAIDNGNKEFRSHFENYSGPEFTSAESVEVYNRLYDMGKKGYIGKQSVGMNHTQSQMLALQGKAAMVPSGDWIENEMKESAPDGFEWGYMAVPFSNNPETPIHINNGLSYAFQIWANKPDLSKQWAKEFLVSLMTNEVQQILVDKGGAFPLRSDFMDDPARAANMKPLQKSIATYLSENNVVLELKSRKVVLNSPDYVAAYKHVQDNTALILTGQKEPLPILEEGEKLLLKAVEAAGK
ncbi:extracellular solute-binding protein [Paenibacillus sp. strain BS8-2]